MVAIQSSFTSSKRNLYKNYPFCPKYDGEKESRNFYFEIPQIFAPNYKFSNKTNLLPALSIKVKKNHF